MCVSELLELRQTGGQREELKEMDVRRMQRGLRLSVEPLKNGVENQCGTARGGCGATSEERSSERERGGDDTELLKRSGDD